MISKRRRPCPLPRAPRSCQGPQHQRYWAAGGQSSRRPESPLLPGLTREAFRDRIVAGLLESCARGGLERTFLWRPGSTRPMTLLRLRAGLGYCLGPQGPVLTNCVLVEVASSFDPTTQRFKHQITDVTLTPP